MIEWLKLHGGRIGLVLLLGLVMYSVVRRMTPRLLRRTIVRQMKDQPEIEVTKRLDTLVGVINNTIGFAIGGFVIFTLLAEVGVNIGPALASLGIVGLAIGFGAQNLVRDVINGLFILVENQYGVGDVITVVGLSGLVQDVNLRRTIIRDLDGVVHVIPNGQISVASNFTKEFSRVNMNVSIPYGTDLDHVIELLNRIGSELARDPGWNEKIIKAPQVLRVDSLGTSGVEVKMCGDTLPGLQWEVTGELRRRIKNGFDREHIAIPYPQLDVHLARP